MNLNSYIPSADTIFNDNPHQNDDKFHTPPHKKNIQELNTMIQGVSPFKKNLQNIFKQPMLFIKERTPNSIKSIESLSGSKTLLKQQMNESFQKIDTLKDAGFQRKLPMVLGQIDPSPMQTSQMTTEKKKNPEKSKHLFSEGVSEILNYPANKQFNREYNLKFEDSEKRSNDIIVSKGKSCNCKRTKCLKLYCDCFAAGELCGPDCSCNSCNNNQSKNSERNKVVENLLEKNPNAFNGKINKQDQLKQGHIKGCNCRKSGCQKKYCECYQAGVKCNELCKCETCRNSDYNRVNNFDIRKIQQFINTCSNTQATQHILQGNGYFIIPTENLQHLLQRSDSLEPNLQKMVKVETKENP